VPSANEFYGVSRNRVALVSKLQGRHSFGSRRLEGVSSGLYQFGKRYSATAQKVVWRDGVASGMIGMRPFV
jgi:hypothetical protein